MVNAFEEVHGRVSQKATTNFKVFFFLEQLTMKIILKAIQCNKQNSQIKQYINIQT